MASKHERLREISAMVTEYTKMSRFVAFSYDDMKFLLARLDEVVKLARRYRLAISVDTLPVSYRLALPIDIDELDAELRRCLAELEKGE